MESEVMSYIKWQDLGHLYKRSLAIEVSLKIKQGFNHRLLPFLLSFTEPKRGIVLLEVKRKKTELGRKSLSYRKELKKARCFEVRLKHNRTGLNNITLTKGPQQISIARAVCFPILRPRNILWKIFLLFI